ncbi:MAG: diguanylate cyclase, partial [Gemmatimonadaceae bacterium]
SDQLRGNVQAVLAAVQRGAGAAGMSLGDSLSARAQYATASDEAAREMARLRVQAAPDPALTPAVDRLDARVRGFLGSLGAAMRNPSGQVPLTALTPVSAAADTVLSEHARSTAAARQRPLAVASRTRVMLRLTWVAALLLLGAGLLAFWGDLQAQRAKASEAATAAPAGSAKARPDADTLSALSLVDELTDLYNRRGFLALAEQQLKLARRSRRELVLLFVDLDDFKLINDTYGHGEGDVALKRAAAILKKTFRESDIVARLGGDEFVILAAETGSSAGIVDRLRRELRLRNKEDGYPYTLSFSVGAARFDPSNPPSIEALLQTADAMLYEQKREKRQAQATAD